REKWHLTDPDVLAWAMTGEVDREVFSWLTEFQKVIEPAAAEIAAVRASKGARANIKRQMKELERANDRIVRVGVRGCRECLFGVKVGVLFP
ncbi:MAG: hypothetical protein ACJ07L_00310, partial [Opitutales bacterium]